MELSKATMDVYVNESNLMAATQGLPFAGYNSRINKDLAFKITIDLNLVEDLMDARMYNKDKKVYKIVLKEAKTN